MKTQNIKKIVLIFLLSCSATISAQVGINTSTPDAASILDIVSTNKGLLIPRVALTSSTMDLDGLGSGNPSGLMVYNTSGPVGVGFYFWNGSEWRGVDNSTSLEPSVANISCGIAKLSPTSYTAGIPYTGILTIPYTDGNGGAYQGGQVFTSNGLTFTLQGDKLGYVKGNLLFKVTGTPTASSPATATLAINSTTIPFFTGTACTVTVGNSQVADISSTPSLGPLVATSNPVAGFERVVTTPDGRFSVRVFVVAGQAISTGDIQIRSNSGTPTIIWNAKTNYTGVYLVNGNNGMAFPAANVWYGNSGGNATAMAANTAFGDADAYETTAEYRRYTFTTSDPLDKALYTFTYTMVASATTLIANAANAPLVKCVLNVEQIKS